MQVSRCRLFATLAAVGKPLVHREKRSTRPPTLVSRIFDSYSGKVRPGVCLQTYTRLGTDDPWPGRSSDFYLPKKTSHPGGLFRTSGQTSKQSSAPESEQPQGTKPILWGNSGSELVSRRMVCNNDVLSEAAETEHDENLHVQACRRVVLSKGRVGMSCRLSMIVEAIGVQS